MGLVSSATTQPAAAPNPQPAQLQNPVLQQVESSVEAKIKPEAKSMYQSIVVASMKLAFDKSTNPMLMKGLKSSPDMAKNVSLICAGMIGTVFDQVKPDINVFLVAAVPASITLMCQILQFAEQSRMVQVTPDVVAKCSAATAKAVLNKFGVDQNKINQAVSNGQKSSGAQPAMGV